MDALSFGPWKVETVMGEGSFAHVYRAVHAEHPDRRAAVKVLREEWRKRRMFRERFADEAQTAELIGEGAARIRALAAYHGADVEGPTPWIAVEWIDGLPLDQVITSGRLADGALVPRGTDDRTAFASRIIHDVAEALAYSHRRGIVHRDIKPENILCAKDGRFVLIDFGIARDARGKRHTSEDLPSPMTPDYAAPELLRSDVPEHLEGALDVYALGCTFLEILTGALSPITRTDDGGAHAGYIPRRFSIDLPDVFPHVTRQLIRWMTQPNGASRPSIGQVLAVLGSGITPPEVLDDDALRAGLESGVYPGAAGTVVAAESSLGIHAMPGAAPATLPSGVWQDPQSGSAHVSMDTGVHVTPADNPPAMLRTGPTPSMSGGVARMPQDRPALARPGADQRQAGYYPMQRPDGGGVARPSGRPNISDKPMRSGPSKSDASKGSSASPLRIALELVLLLFALAGGFYWYSQQQKPQGIPDPVLSATTDEGVALDVAPVEAAPAPVQEAPAQPEPAAAASDDLGDILSIKSRPPGASIKIDERPVGKTPLKVRLTPGPHVVTFTSDDKRPIVRVVQGGTAEQLVVDIKQAAAQTDIFVFASGFEGVPVRIDGERKGSIPLVVPVKPGVHAIEMLAGGVPRRKDLYIAPAQTTRVDMSR